MRLSAPENLAESRVTIDLQKKFLDFSVVLLRSDFVLVSEKNHMKAHKNQWLLPLPSLPELPCGATNQGIHPGGEGADAFAVT
jgi:hypothetical protein